MRLITHCCCGCSLRSVTLVIGYIQLLLFTVPLLIGIFFAPGDMSAIRRSYSPASEGSVFVSISAALAIVISIFLIIGATKGNMLLLLPWIGNTMVGIVASALVWIYGLIKVGRDPLAALVTFGFFLMLGICLLSLLVVVSYFEELRKKIVEGTGSTSSRTRNVERRLLALEATVDSLGQTV